ncbi:MAG: hypothetical protein R3B41_02620 [Candidatus Doudnabacteria bacterium]
MQHIAETLQPMLGDFAPINVTVANPLEHLQNFKETGLSPYEALSFVTTIGLALWKGELHEKSTFKFITSL